MKFLRELAIRYDWSGLFLLLLVVSTLLLPSADKMLLHGVVFASCFQDANLIGTYFCDRLLKGGLMILRLGFGDLELGRHAYVSTVNRNGRKVTGK